MQTVLLLLVVFMFFFVVYLCWFLVMDSHTQKQKQASKQASKQNNPTTEMNRLDTTKVSYVQVVSSKVILEDYDLMIYHPIKDFLLIIKPYYIYCLCSLLLDMTLNMIE